MKAIKLLSFAIVALFLVMTVWLPIGGAMDVPPTKVVKDKVTVDQAAATGADVRLFFKGTALTPTAPGGNSSSDKTACPGLSHGGKRKGTICGEWAITINGDTTVSGSLSISLWASSSASAKNVGFRVNLYRDGGNTQSYFTNRQDLGPSPVRFTATGSYSQQFNVGNKFSAQLVWLSDPTHGVGPSGGGDFLYGNAAFDSNVKVTFDKHPISVTNITTPVVASDSVNVKAEFKDILGGDPTTFTYSIAITGATTASPAHIDAPKASAQGNISAVAWTWHSKLDSAKSGQYTLAVGISYDGNSTATNSTQLKITIPVKGGGGGGGLLPNLGLGGKGGSSSLLLILVLIIIIVVAVVAVVLVRKRKKGGKKKKRAKDEDDEDEDEDEEEEEDD